MKTLIVILFFLFTMNGKATAQQKKIKFYYYPVANVYYNTTTATYSYIENNNWVSATSLPASYTIKHAPRQVIFHNNAQVWNNNYHHRVTYAPGAKAIESGYLETKPDKPKSTLFKRSKVNRIEKL